MLPVAIVDRVVVTYTRDGTPWGRAQLIHLSLQKRYRNDVIEESDVGEDAGYFGAEGDAQRAVVEQVSIDIYVMRGLAEGVYVYAFVRQVVGDVSDNPSVRRAVLDVDPFAPLIIPTNSAPCPTSLKLTST